MRFFDFKLGEVEFSRVPAGGALGLDEGTTFILNDKPELLDAAVEQDSIVLTFELREEMVLGKGRVTASPGRYQVIIDLYREEDDTFRLGLSTWVPKVEKLD